MNYQMKIGIIFSTERKKATVQVVDWLISALEQKGFNMEVGMSNEFQKFDCDGYIVGSAVYGFHVLEVLVNFLEENEEHFQGKPVATFVVCQLVKLSRLYKKEISKKLPVEPVSQAVFKGYRERKGKFEKQESKAFEWVNEIDLKFTNRIVNPEVIKKNVQGVRS